MILEEKILNKEDELMGTKQVKYCSMLDIFVELWTMATLKEGQIYGFKVINYGGKLIYKQTFIELAPLLY